MSATFIDRIPLAAALETTAERWEGKRSAPVLLGQGRQAIRTIRLDLDVHHVEDVTHEHIKTLVTTWKADGLAKTTIRKRLLVLGQMGCPTKGTMIGGPAVGKWALNASAMQDLLVWLRGPTTSPRFVRTRPELADYVEWTCHTGLRVEESLRQVWGDVTFKRDSETGELVAKGMSIIVAGTKTEGSRATIRLGEKAGEILVKRYLAAPSQDPSAKVFPESYHNMQRLWLECRKFLGVTNPTCTLKSLRRSAARYLHVDRGMPLDVLRDYLRHNNVQTTIQYLKIAGGYSEDVQARYL